MSDPPILLVAPIFHEVGAARALELLRGVDLPNATKYVVARGKCEAQHDIKSLNVESGYPRAPYDLQTLASWAEVGPNDPRFRDGYDLFCLRTLLALAGAFEVAALVRGATRPARWSASPVGLSGSLYVTRFDEARPDQVDVLFNLAHPQAPIFLEMAWDLYATGAIYSMPSYTIDAALAAAADAVGFTQQFESHP